MTDDAANRQRALELLEHNHTFPGPYTLRVVVRPDARARALAAVEAAAGGVHETSERPSSKGNYVSLRLRIEVRSAEGVLEVYDALKLVDGVLATL